MSIRNIGKNRELRTTLQGIFFPMSKHKYFSKEAYRQNELLLKQYGGEARGKDSSTPQK